MLNRTISFILIALSLSVSGPIGCATYACTHQYPKCTGLYPATRYDIGVVAHPNDEYEGGERILASVFGLLDLPLSFVLDTVILPFDIIEGRGENSPSAKTLENSSDNKAQDADAMK